MLLRDYIIKAINNPLHALSNIEIDTTNVDGCEVMALLEKAKLIFENTVNENAFWNNILPVIPEHLLADSLVCYLVDNKIALLTLGHMKLKDKWLNKLSKYVPEATFTLADYYCSDAYSIEQFQRFLKENTLNTDLFVYLLSISRLDELKRKYLYYYASTFCEVKIVEMARQYAYAWYLSITDNIQSIEDALTKDIPLYLVAISSNFNTPDEILKELTQIKNVKNGSYIRNFSQNTLKLKSHS